MFTDILFTIGFILSGLIIGIFGIGCTLATWFSAFSLVGISLIIFGIMFAVANVYEIWN